MQMLHSIKIYAYINTNRSSLATGYQEQVNLMEAMTAELLYYHTRAATKTDSR